MRHNADELAVLAVDAAAAVAWDRKGVVMDITRRGVEHRNTAAASVMPWHA